MNSNNHNEMDEKLFGNARNTSKNYELELLAEKQHNLEKRIIKDIIVCTLAVIVFSSLAYFLNLVEMLAEMLNRPEIREIDPLIVVIIYAVWMIGIFVLRRLYELRKIADERRQLVEQLHSALRTETVERMASGLAHDFNNILTIIAGVTELCLMEDETHKTHRDNLLNIKHAVKKATGLVKQLMTLGSGKPARSNEIDLNMSVSEMAPLLHSLTGSEIELRTFLHPQLGTIKADKTQIDDILINLTKNAMDAISNMDTVNGIITITTSNIRLDDADECRKLELKPGDYVILSVADNGYGMDPNIIPHIFEPYFTTKAEGTGLGLAMVMSLVKQNGGKIDLQSELGKGSVFRIFFPVTKTTTRVMEFARSSPYAASFLKSLQQTE